jgi:hypothetical protein
MNPTFCTREPEIIAALMNGALPDELQAHAAVCEICSEIVQVTQALVHEVASDSAELRPPDAAVVWRRAQSLAREKAIAKATQSIRIARISTMVAASIALPWLVVSFPISSSWISDSAHLLKAVDFSFSSTATAMILFGAIGGLFLITLSSWYVLRHE